MRCRKHSTDLSSIVGVCASCLRQRLLLLIDAQSQQQHNSDHRISDAVIPPDVLVFPRSVSPYITRRKSDNSATWQLPSSQLQHSLSDHRFFSTPQIGPNGAIVADSLYRKEAKKKRDKCSVFSRLFRSKTQRFDSDSRVFDTKSRESVTSASSSWWWFSKRKAKSRMSSFGYNNNNKFEERSRRGMSPRTVDSDEECGCSSESSPRWKATPNRGGRRRNESRNMSAGLAFCLSPLVRPSPNHQWNSKGMPQAEAAVLADAVGFRGNRSRKLANFGRFHPDY